MIRNEITLARSVTFGSHCNANQTAMHFPTFLKFNAPTTFNFEIFPWINIVTTSSRSYTKDTKLVRYELELVGAEINKLLKKGSAFYTPASSAVLMAESFLKNKRIIIPCATYLNGEYGVKNLYVGVPAIIGKTGVEKIIELKLNSLEKKQFNQSVKAVRKLTNLASKIL